MKEEEEREFYEEQAERIRQAEYAEEEKRRLVEREKYIAEQTENMSEEDKYNWIKNFEYEEREEMWEWWDCNSYVYEDAYTQYEKRRKQDAERLSNWEKNIKISL
jgi:hypothetical protein